MPLETFTGPALEPLFQEVQNRLGGNAMLVHTWKVQQTDGNLAYRVLAGDPWSADEGINDYLPRRNARELTALSPLDVPMRKRPTKTTKPFTLALVGPTGAGKTTTIGKLIGNSRIFGRKRVGLLSLDTYRVGAIEQLQTYAEIASVPFQAVYDSSELHVALQKLGDNDVIVVDTPGRGPRRESDQKSVWQCVAQIAPDEVHLAIPAGLQAGLLGRTIATYRRCNVTHLLATKLDEMPADWSVFERAARLNLPMRWMTDGQEVPADIKTARPRLLAALTTTKHRARQLVEGAA